MMKEALLDAAEAVLFEHGGRALTLNAVAERAGVSKGGLLYHFPNKEALVQALVARVIAEFDELIGSFDDGGPGSYTRAYVLATFEILTGEARAHRRWSAITAAATDPELAEPLNEAMGRWHKRPCGEDPDPATAMVVRLAAEGLWEVLSHSPGLYDQAELTALRERLLALASG
ncbi:TetR/AcrR family transcriptional regulator [Actinomadura oligospora]|uniref:TetR/AcrR family transcriptional regulator n=1 Tax=Actinomadura oligospora TaxID=111804 RepID=UPI00047E74F4|nr:TetR/AcrR family transcriptional regulator [Actinomadura oligospora]